MSGEAALAFTAASVALGGREILSRVTLDIRPGEFIGVLGPNGAGKTTLMRTILGLVPLSGGSLKIFGKAPERGNPAIGYMPQLRAGGAGLCLSGRDFVASAARGHLWGLPVRGAAARAEIAWALEQVEATSLADRPLGQLSGGERQRLLLAQALLGRPKLLLLDEPLISLDPHHQHAVVDLVKRLGKELGITILFSAHELNPLLGALDRVLYLGSGHAELGAVDDVITPQVLSRLYGSPIDVVRLQGRIFVMSGGHLVEQHEHVHDH